MDRRPSRRSPEIHLRDRGHSAARSMRAGPALANRCQLDVLSPRIFDAEYRAQAGLPGQVGRTMQRRPDELEAKKSAPSVKAEMLSPACSTRCPARGGRAEVVRRIAATAAEDVAFVEPFGDVAIRSAAKIHGKSALPRARASAPAGVEPMTLLSILEAGITRIGDHSPYSRLADFTQGLRRETPDWHLHSAITSPRMYRRPRKLVCAEKGRKPRELSRTLRG
jgi:hypothetical protein